MHERDELNRLIDELESRLRRRGVSGSMKLVGGAALARLFPNDPDVRPTTDVDAIFDPVSDVEDIADEIRIEYRLRPGWLNSAAAPFMAEHRRDSKTSEFEIYPADPCELIAMKMARGAPQDIADLRILSRHLRITSPQALVDIAYAVHGRDSVLLQDGEESYLLFAQDVLDGCDT